MQKRGLAVCLIVSILLISSVSAFSFSEFFDNLFNGKITGRTIDTTSDGLIAYYNFDNNVQDSSGRGVNGVVGGSPIYVPGKIGNAIDFNGINQYVEFANSNSPKLGNSHTISGWVYARNNPVGGSIISKWCGLCYSGVYNARSYTVGVNGGKIDYGISTAGGQLDSGFHSFKSNSVLPTNQWVFFAVTYNGTRRTTYINGVEDIHIDRTGDIFQSNSDVQIGATKDAGYRGFFNGSVDEVRFYNRTLSASEVQQLYSSSSIVIQQPVTCNTTRTCVDSDNGLNLTFKGSVSGSVSTACSDGTGSVGLGSSMVDVCVSSSVVRERYCDSGNYSNYTDVDCSSLGSGFSCDDGKCVQAAVIIPVLTCNDSDNGLSYYTLGHCTDSYGGNMSDGCIISNSDNNGWLREITCNDYGNGNRCQMNDYNCSNGCLNGTCVVDTNLNCTDSDGGANYYVKGNTTGYEMSLVNYRTITDYCGVEYADLGKLHEYYCGRGNEQIEQISQNTKSNQINELVVDCSLEGKVCVNGACLLNNSVVPGSNCTDSELGVSYYTAGTVNYNGQDYKDSCSGDSLTEYTCFNNAVFNYPAYDCALENKVCQNEACVANGSVVTKTCLGCDYNSKCLPVGYRFLVNSVPSYCDIYGVAPQKVNEENLTMSCQNSYECESNICSSGECVNLEGFKAVLVKIVCGISTMFSSEEGAYEKCVAEYVYGACVSSWNCTDWSNCTNGEQNRTCNDIKNCSNSTSVPASAQNCTIIVHTPVCGDSIVDSGEDCDDGNLINGDGCSSVCLNENALPICGNGVVQTPEECDDSNRINGDGCSENCTAEIVLGSCGNGIKEDGEECDDTNVVNGFGCNATCDIVKVSAVCGDGLIETPEECDDNNSINGDGCSSNCTAEIVLGSCGNNLTDVGEECDGVDFVGDSCIGLNDSFGEAFVAGNLSCNNICGISMSECYTQEDIDYLLSFAGKGEMSYLYSTNDKEATSDLSGWTLIDFGFNYGGASQNSLEGPQSVLTGNVINNGNAITGFDTSGGVDCSQYNGHLSDGTYGPPPSELAKGPLPVKLTDAEKATAGAMALVPFVGPENAANYVINKFAEHAKEVTFSILTEMTVKLDAAAEKACDGKSNGKCVLDKNTVTPVIWTISHDQDNTGEPSCDKGAKSFGPEVVSGSAKDKDTCVANVRAALKQRQEKLFAKAIGQIRGKWCRSDKCNYEVYVYPSYSSPTLVGDLYVMTASIRIAVKCGQTNFTLFGDRDAFVNASSDYTCKSKVCPSSSGGTTGVSGSAVSDEFPCAGKTAGDACIDEEGNTGSCDESCQCNPACGNGKIDEEEECDGSDLNSKTCADVAGVDSEGTLACGADCTFDTSGCSYSGCGDKTCPDGSTPYPPSCDCPPTTCSNGCPDWYAPSCDCQKGYCGDGICGSGEDYNNCPEDCTPTAICGDGSCNNGETCYSCSLDCGQPGPYGCEGSNTGFMASVSNAIGNVGEAIGNFFSSIGCWFGRC